MQIIDKEAFFGTKLEKMSLPSTLTQITCSLDSFKGLKTVDLPGGRLEVSYEELEPRSTLAVFANVKTIFYSPAYHYFGLEEVVLEDSCQLERIGPNAFQNTKLKSFIAPASLREVGWMAFGNCRRLRDVGLSECLEKLGDLCFWGSGVSGVAVPRKVRKHSVSWVRLQKV